MKKVQAKANSYEAPAVEILEVCVEQGFCLSDGASTEPIGGRKEDFEW